MRRTNRAFTLIELLIVLAILSVMAGVTAVALQQLIPRMSMRSRGQSIEVILKQMRLRAIRESRAIEIAVEDGAGTRKKVAEMIPGTEYFLVARRIEILPPDDFVLSLPVPGVSDGAIKLFENTFPNEVVTFTGIGKVEGTGWIKLVVELSPTERLVWEMVVPSLSGDVVSRQYEESF